MNDQFDELAKGLAQSVTRRGALKKFGAGLAGIALAPLGLAKHSQASTIQGGNQGNCKNDKDCAYLGPTAFCGWCVIQPGDGNQWKVKCCKLPPA